MSLILETFTNILQQEVFQEKKKQSGLSFVGFLAESALMELERRDLLKESGFLSFVWYMDNDNTVIIKDARKQGKFVEVQFKNKKVRCLKDNSADCIHCGFALALPGVRRTLTMQ